MICCVCVCVVRICASLCVCDSEREYRAFVWYAFAQSLVIDLLKSQ